MPRRRPPPRTRATPPVRTPSPARVEEGADGYRYQVRTVAAARAVKTYRCPGCDHEVRPGIAHVVAWRIDAGDAAIDDRRHWHAACWAHRRSPTRRWS